jgi:polyisoprenoid-binding protein YceI
MKTLKSIFYLLLVGSVLIACEKKEEKKETTEIKVDTATFTIDTAVSVVKWTGKKVTGQHNGTIKIQSGNISAAGDAVVGGTVVIDMASIKNEDITDAEMKAKLIGHLRSPDFFDVEKYPTATFAITSVSSDTVTGNLTIKGITEPVSFPIDAKVKDNTLKGNGKATFDRAKYDVRYGSGKFFEGLGDKMIYDEVELEFDITATK